MQKRTLSISIGIALGVLLFTAGFFLWPIIRGALPAFTPPPTDITDSIDDKEDNAESPLTLPNGFSISVFAKNLPGARVLALDGLRNIWVSQTSEGAVTRLEINNASTVTTQHALFQNLNRPHGLAFDPENPFLLYIAETNGISRTQTYSEDSLHKIVDLPEGGRHSTRTIGFGPDGKLYVSIGSSCDVCVEEDTRRATISKMNPDGTRFEQVAQGLRNAVFFRWHPETEALFATEMGRDWLGDNLPPDEINIIEQGNNYGWPECYGKNILDTDFHKEDHQHIRAHCTESFEMPSYIDLAAHSAPLGLDFVPPNSSWPEEYWYDLIVAYHGSWNRSTPTGYKVVRIPLDKDGNQEGERTDFITGWLQGNRALGRPADILITQNAMYISDDHAGVIYQVVYEGEN